jgi:hypothetical protein
MTATLPRLPTVGAIARRYGAQTHQVEHILKTRDIQPIGKAGSAYVYSDSDVEYIGAELRRIQRDREGGDVHAA